MKRYATPAFVFFFPLVYYFRYVFPNSGMLILQNDFGYLYFVYKAYLLDVLAHGHIPWWSPAEAAGYDFFGNPFSAVLYPPNLLLLLVRLVTGNYNTWFHQIFAVLGVSWFALGLYRWLHRLFAQPAAAAFAAIAISTCWMVSEFLRFPNAIHALAWLPWGLRALYDTHHDSRLRHVYWGAACLFCQTTAGYPYFVVYSFLLYGGYVLYLHWTTGKPWKGRAAREVLLLAIPVLLTLPYTQAVSHLMASTADRTGGDFSYATDHYDYGPLDLIGSLIFPPVVTVEGCFYAGSLAVFMLVIYFWREPDARQKVALALGAFGFLAMMFGFRSFLFAPVWSITPVINQMRVFGRMATMLLPILAIVLHQGYVLLWQELQKPQAERQVTTRVVCSIFGVILLLQAYLYAVREPLHGEYASLTVPTLPAGSLEVDFLMYTLLTLGVVLLVLHIDWAQLRFGPALACALLIGVMTQDTGTQGRFLWAQPVAQGLVERGAPSSGGFAQRAWTAAKTEGDFYRLVRDYFELDRNGNSGELTWRGLTRNVILNWDYQRYNDFVHRWSGDAALMNHLVGKQKLFIYETPTTDPKAFLKQARAAQALASEPIPKQFTGSDLQVEVTTSAPCRLAWIDNWAEGWSAQVDGKAVPVELLLGTFKGVKLSTPGKHSVSFRYRPSVSAIGYGGLALGIVLLLLPVWLRRRGLLKPA